LPVTVTIAKRLSGYHYEIHHEGRKVGGGYAKTKAEAQRRAAEHKAEFEADKS
jgi:hypothetical protein